MALGPIEVVMIAFPGKQVHTARSSPSSLG